MEATADMSLPRVASAEDELLDWLRRDAILKADPSTRIVGRTGEPAACMLYCWPLTLSADGCARIADALLGALADFRATQIAAFGLGAYPLMTACVLRGAGQYTGLALRADKKVHGAAGRQIEGEGDRRSPVVLVDDSISSGTSLRNATSILERAGYTVEGAVCLVNFSRRGGVERARARGYRVAALYDAWDDMQFPRPERPPLFLRFLPETWSSDQVAEGLHPAQVARRVAEHLLSTGEVLKPPLRFAEDEFGPGGVWVSFRRRDNDRRLAREGFWHFDITDADPARDVVIATARAVARMARFLTPALLAELKIAVSFFSELEPIKPRDLDFARYGIVVRSQHIPAKMGGALPNTQLFTSSIEQYRHARWTNARVGLYEPHDLFRHDVRKRIEPGESWPAYGEGESDTDAWTRDPGLGEALLQRTLNVMAAQSRGDHDRDTIPLNSELAPESLCAVVVSIYDRGLIGCAVAAGQTLDEMLVAATQHALTDPRFEQRRRASTWPRSVTVSLLYNTEHLGPADADRVAWRLRAGRDSFSVRQGGRRALFVDSVIPHHCWSKRQAVDALMAKAGIEQARVEQGSVDWRTYKTATWGSLGGPIHRVEFGARARSLEDRIDADDATALSEHLIRRLDLAGWPASRVNARLGTYVRTGAAARCLHALQVLHTAGHSHQRLDWVQAAGAGLRYACNHLIDGSAPSLDMPDHDCGPSADAMLLNTVALVAQSGNHSLLERVDPLARRIQSWVRSDGSVLPEGWLPSTADVDYLPGGVLLALARYSLISGSQADVDWTASREWFARRFRLTHHWALASWHAQLWPVVAELTGDPRHLDFAFELADWMVERQLRADGSFLTDMSATPSFHTACAAVGVATAWRAAAESGDKTRAVRYARSWRESQRFLDGLLLRIEDTYWMPEPTIAMGGVRARSSSFDMRVDMTSETLQALLLGQEVE